MRESVRRSQTAATILARHGPGLAVVGAEPLADARRMGGGLQGIAAIETRVALAAERIGHDRDIGKHRQRVGRHAGIAQRQPGGFHFLVGIDAHDFDELPQGVERGAGKLALIGEIAGIFIWLDAGHGRVRPGPGR